MVISQPQSLSHAQYVKNQLETKLLKLGLYNIFLQKLIRIILFFFRHYAFTHQKIFELTDLTPDNIIPPGIVKKNRGNPGPRTPKKMPKTPEKILEREEASNGEVGVREVRDPSESVSSTNGENMSGVVSEEPAGEVSEDDRGEKEGEEQQQEETLCDNS